MEPKYPQGGDPSYKSPTSPHPPGAGLAGREAGRGREVLGALNSEETSQAGALQDPESEQESEPQQRPRPFPSLRSRSLPWLPGPIGPGTPFLPWKGREGGARAHVLLSGSSAWAPQPEPLPSRPGPPAPPPPSLGTMAAPSRHPLPPAGLALSLPDKAGRATGPGRGLRGRSPPKRRVGGQRRDAGPAALSRGTGAPVWAWALEGWGCGKD